MDETVVMPPLPPDPLPPRYESLGELGRGGMGIVYKARDRETGEILAIKVLKGDIAADTQVLDRFKNELRLARQITHRNVARLYEFHRSNETVYLSMEFVEGESLRSLMERSGKLPVDQAIGFVRQLAAGLSKAHRQSIAHRDLKPENIMISPRGESLVYEESDRIAREGVSQAELDALATDALRRRAFQFVGKATRALIMVQVLTAYAEFDAVNRWESEESRVSRDTVQQMAKKYFGAANRTVLVVKR